MTNQVRFLTAGKLSSTSGQIDIDLMTGAFTIKGPIGNVVIGDLEKGDVAARVDEAPSVEPLRFGGVTFYGELARNLRDVQAMLAAHGAGELKLVKHGGEPGKHAYVIDGQVFINQAAIDSERALADALKSWKPGEALKVGGVSQMLDSQFLVSADRWRVQMTTDPQGRYVIAGVGSGIESRKPDIVEAIKSGDAGAILDAISSHIQESRLGKELLDEVAKINAASLGGINKRLDELQQKQGAENRAAAERIDILAKKVADMQMVKEQIRASPVLGGYTGGTALL